jgi:hypothetical protein
MRKALTIALLLGTGACSRSEQPPAQPITPAAAAAPAAPVGPTPQTMQTIAGRLRDEAASRPAGALRAEAVLAALDAAGVRVGEARQFLGATARARYCAGGATPGGLAVAVCEYDSPAAAEAGRAYVEDRYAVMNSFRRIHVRGATTLTVATAPAVALGDEAARAVRVFERM